MKELLEKRKYKLEGLLRLKDSMEKMIRIGGSPEDMLRLLEGTIDATVEGIEDIEKETYGGI